MTTGLEIAIECLTFCSYLVISILVLVMYLRHAKYIDTFINRILIITCGLFLMLCAFTHLNSAIYGERNIYLSIACGAISFISAYCFLSTYKKFDDLLKMRFHTMDIIKEEIVRDLGAGYDVRGVFSETYMRCGFLDGERVETPISFEGDLLEKSVIKIKKNYYRITKVIKLSIRSIAKLNINDIEEPRPIIYNVFGYDATAEIHCLTENERLNEVKMDVCMSTAHDVRTPLNSMGIVISCLQSMRDSVGENIVEYDKLLDEGYVNLEIINLIITQLLEIGKLGKNEKIRPTIGMVDTQTLAGRIVKIGERISGEKVKFTCELDTDTPKFFFSDSDWIWQIILNMITNSGKYTYSGYISIFISIKESILSIIVKDTGIGIKDEEKKTVFNKFFTSKNFGHDSHGIGLYSVKMKIDSLNGDIIVKDNPDNGTIFEVNIPVTIQKPILKIETSSVEKKKCLVVDDTPTIRRMMSRLLEKHIVETAENGSIALQMMKKNEYDLVLLDMFMPTMDGLECIKRFRCWEVKNRDKKQIIYSMSANHTPDIELFDGSLPKPIDGKRLSMILSEI